MAKARNISKSLYNYTTEYSKIQLHSNKKYDYHYYNPNVSNCRDKLYINWI